MSLPPELVTPIQVALTLAITNLVMEGFKDLAAALGKLLKREVNLSPAAKIFAVALSGCAVSIVVGLINLGLGAIPPLYYPVVQAVLAILVSIFGAMGLRRRQRRTEL